MSESNDSENGLLRSAVGTSRVVGVPTEAVSSFLPEASLTVVTFAYVELPADAFELGGEILLRR